MAKVYKQPSLVSGKSVSDILNMDINAFNSLKLPEMRKVVGRLVSAGNKRLRSFERAGERSPATRHIEKSGGVFSTRGKSLNELRAEYIRAKNFLESKTGTRKGWTEVKKKIISSLEKKGVFMTLEQFNDVWESYEKLKELSPEVANKAFKYTSLQNVQNMVEDTNFSADEIATKLHDELTEIYEEQAGLNNGVSGVSGFFEVQ